MLRITSSLFAFILSIGVSAGVYFIFKPLNIDKRFRYKQKINIVVYILLLVLASIIYISMWVFEVFSPRFMGMQWLVPEKYAVVPLMLCIFFIYKMVHKINIQAKIDEGVDFEEENLPSQYYEKNGEIFLGGQYGTLRSVLCIACIVTTVILSFVVGVLHFINFQGLLANKITVTYYPFLLVPVFFGELIAYFSGQSEKVKKHQKIKQDNSSKDSDIIWKNLNDEYHRIWGDHILGGYYVRNKYKQIVITPQKKKGRKNSKASKITEKIAQDNAIDKVQESLYSKFLYPVMRGENLIISSCHVKNYSEIIIPLVNIMFSANKKMLFLCDSSTTVSECKKWMEELGLKTSDSKTVVEVLDYQNTVTVKMDGNVDIYIGTADLALNSKVVSDMIDVVFCINADKAISEDSMSLNLLASVLNTDKFKQTQYILFGNSVNGLRQTASQIFMTNDFEYLSVNPSVDCSLTANFWPTDRGWLQAGVLPGFVAQNLGQLLPLAIPAIKEEVAKAALEEDAPDKVLVVSGKQSFNDQVVALKNAEPLLKKYMESKVVNIEDSVIFSKNENYIDIPQDSIVIVEDTFNNAAMALLNWLKYAKSNMLLNIVSRPYLLRDYIVSNMDFFIGNAGLISSILPVPKTNIKMSVYRLINQLCFGDVAEETLLMEIKNCDSTFKIDVSNLDQVQFVTGALESLTERAFNTHIHYDTYLTSQKKTVGNSFDEKRYYKLLPSIKYELPERLFKNISFVDSEQSEKILKRIPVFDLYQNYLEGMSVSFDDKFYSIFKIDYSNGIVELTPNSTDSGYMYRQHRTVSIDSSSKAIARDLPTVYVRSSVLRKSIIQCNLEVNTEGYYIFNNAIDLEPGNFKYNDVDSNKKGLRRRYKSANIFAININSPVIEAYLPEERFKLSFTLSTIINEIFETLFPDIKQYILTRTVVANEADFDEFKDEEILRMFAPIVDTSAENGINIYITEDTELEKGVTDTIVEKFNDVLMIMFDYIHWVEKETNRFEAGRYETNTGDFIEFQNLEKERFLKYGSDNLSPAIDINLAYKCLLDLLLSSSDTITESRRRIVHVRNEKDPFAASVQEDSIEQEIQMNEQENQAIVDNARTMEQSQNNAYAQPQPSDSTQVNQIYGTVLNSNEANKSQEDINPESDITEDQPIIEDDKDDSAKSNDSPKNRFARDDDDPSLQVNAEDESLDESTEDNELTDINALMSSMSDEEQKED